MTDRVLEMLRRMRSFFRDKKLNHDLDEEIAAHLELAIEENLQRGMTPGEARRQALIRFGGVGQAKERHRDARGLPVLDVLLQDLRYALRTFRRNPGFTLVAILILALGIGANVAVFSVVNTIMLRPLPFPNSQQLAWLASNRGVGPLSLVTYKVDVYEELQRHNQSFEQTTSYNPFFGNGETKLIGRGEPQPVLGLMIAENFFQTLGVQPEFGRLFLPEECQKGGSPAVILGHAFWQQQFGGDPAIVGKSIMLDRSNLTVVGVLPATFDFGSVFSPGTRMDVYVPARMDVLRNWGNTLALVGRLKPGVTVAQAQAEVDVLLPQLRAAHQEWHFGYPTTITGLKDHVSGKLQRALTVLWCAVGLIFLIICVNLSNLILARTAARSKEFALRSALGAGRGRLVRQLLTESVVLSLAGAALGIGLGYAVTSYIAQQGSIALPLLSSLHVDEVTLAWAGLITIAAVLIFGLVPGLKISAGNPQAALKDSGHGLSEGKRHTRLRSGLVISEIALACVLLVGAGLMLRSFLRVLDVDPGFEPGQANVITMDIDDGGDRDRRAAILQEMLHQVVAIPGVQAAGITDMLPLGRNRSWGFEAKGRDYPKEENPSAIVRIVTPGYIGAMGMRLLKGRDFTWRDTNKSEKVIIINQEAALRHWPGEDPIGKLAYGIGDGESKVIGIISDVRQGGLEDTAGAEVYAPATQEDPEGAELVVRSTLPPEVLRPSVIGVLRSLGPNQLAAEFRPVQRLVDHAVSPRKFFALLIGVFAALGLLLAALGIYGVVSYSVTRQTQEIGIRMALGATAGRVQFSVMTKTLRLVVAGVAFGTFTSMLATKFIASLLYGTVPTDPATFAGTVLLLSVVAIAAGYIPARRASRIDPIIALRGQ